MRFILDNDIKTAKILFKEKVIKDIYSSSFRKKLSRENFIKDSFWLQYGNQMISVFPSSELFIYIYKELLKNYDHDIIYKIIKDINMVLRDIIISEHFKRCYNIDPIYTAFHLEIIGMLKEMPNYLFKESSNINVINIDKYRMFCLSNGISKYYHNTNELFSINQNKRQDRIISLFSETLPDMSEIPVKVIFEAKKKDKFRSLPYLAEEISLKKDISSEDLVKYFDEKVWEFAANSLKISATEVLMNVMGYYPDTGISATIQLFSQFKGLVSKYEMYRNNGWIIPIHELKNYSNK